MNISQLNIQYGNSHIDDLVLEIGRSDYDVILLQEIGDNMHEKISMLTDYFPHSVGTSHLENQPSGMALFSRWPIINRKIHDLGYIEEKVI